MDPFRQPLQNPQPVLVLDLFQDLLENLLSLLSGLSAEDWDRPTVCAGWSVKDVALHLLGGEIGNLSWRRDGVRSGRQITSQQELVTFINRWNEDWVRSARRISPRLLIDLLALTGPALNEYFETLDPHATGGPVSWVGPEPAPVWLDMAREYTERWHHQQHIRDAVGKPGLKEPRYLAPVLAAENTAAENTAVTLTITGPSGGRWTVVREGKWQAVRRRPRAAAGGGGDRRGQRLADLHPRAQPGGSPGRGHPARKPPAGRTHPRDGIDYRLGVNTRL